MHLASRVCLLAGQIISMTYSDWQNHAHTCERAYSGYKINTYKVVLHVSRDAGIAGGGGGGRRCPLDFKQGFFADFLLLIKY